MVNYCLGFIECFKNKLMVSEPIFSFKNKLYSLPPIQYFEDLNSFTTPHYIHHLDYPLARSCLGLKLLATDESGPKCNNSARTTGLGSCRLAECPCHPLAVASFQPSAFSFQFSDLGQACRTWLSLGPAEKLATLRTVLRISPYRHIAMLT